MGVDSKMNSRIYPEFRRTQGSRILDSDRFTIQWPYNAQPNRLFQRSHPVDSENKMSEPVVIINDILPPQKDIPSYTAITRSARNKDNFHRAMGPIIVLGQIFGLFPVCGIMEDDASHIKFKWLSWRVFYTSFTILAETFVLCLCTARLYTIGFNIHTASQVVFYGSTFLTTILFFRLSYRWPIIARAIEKEESRSVPYNSAKKRTTLITNFRIFSFFILFTAFVEHLLSILSGFAAVYGCDRDNTILVGFYTSSFPQVFTYTSYAHWKAFLLQVYNFCVTFNWNYMDLFIVLMSICLSSRFDKLNQCITAAKGKHLPEHFWKVTRNEYANLANLVGLIDENINELIILSFSNNLYIICMQLFNSFDSAHDDNAVVPCWKRLYNGFFTTAYFIFSFTFLISRFITVSLTASRIYTNSRIPLKTLFSVGTETYCVEVQRFIDHVTSDIVAFTGMKFFYITRGLILTIAGTVVTYELVLVQFNQPPPSVKANITLKDNCGSIDSIKTTD